MTLTTNGQDGSPPPKRSMIAQSNWCSLTPSIFMNEFCYLLDTKHIIISTDDWKSKGACDGNAAVGERHGDACGNY